MSREGERAGWPFLALPASGLLPIPHSLVKRAGREGGTGAGGADAGRGEREGGREEEAMPQNLDPKMALLSRANRGATGAAGGDRRERERERHLWLMLASMWLSSLLLVQISNAFCFYSVPFCITTPKGAL